MSWETITIERSGPVRKALLASTLLGLLGSPLFAQEVRIMVLNGRNGKPVTNECVNVSLGSWHGGDLIAPTNKDGIVLLRFDNGQVTADGSPPRACNGMAFLGPKALPSGVTTVAITSDEYVDCQEWARVVPGESPKDLLNRAPSYSIARILRSGVTASNRCGKYKAKASPGELIFFVRPMSLWERMRE